MPGWFITAIVFFVLAALIGAGSFFAPDAEEYGKVTPRDVVRLTAYTFGALTAICLIIASFNIVSTRNVGIVTSFGRPAGECGAGPCWTLPWQKVTEMDGAIQLQSFEGKSFDDPGTAIKVRLGNNSTAFVEANLNWRLLPDKAPQMFQDYRTFDNIRQNLVDRQLQTMLSHRFATFNPQQQTQGADLPGIANLVKTDLQSAVGAEIEIQSVRIPGIFYDQGTQQRIDQFNQKAQETKNAEQDVKTAEQQRLAAEQRAAQAKPDLTVAQFNCIMEAVAQHRPNDAAGCWGQIAGNGSQSIVQIPKP